jgi:prepilin-type processing-associated H-X9-DG protein
VAETGQPLRQQNYKVELGEAFLRDNRVNGSSPNGGFYSRHAGGASFTMCDGAVRWIDNSISSDLYSALAAINGGSDEGVGLPAGIAATKGLD